MSSVASAAVLITAENVVCGKPDPEGYVLAAQSLGTSAEHCLVFEDARAGIEAGQRAGSEVIVITAARPHAFETDCATVRDFRQVRFRLR